MTLPRLLADFLSLILSGWLFYLSAFLFALEIAAAVFKEEPKRIGFASSEESRMYKWASRWRKLPFGYIAAVCLLLSAFSAWKSERIVLQSVIAQRANDVGNLNSCTSDLRNAITRSDIFERINTSQQSTFNECVLSLTKVNTPQPLRITFRSFDLGGDTRNESKKIGVIILRANKAVTGFRLALRCVQPFELAQAKMSASMGVLNSSSERATPTEAVLRFSNATWELDEPILLFVSGIELQVHRCGATLL
jgi:hypothetical protein